MNTSKIPKKQILLPLDPPRYTSAIDKNISSSNSNDPIPKGTLPSQIRIENMLQKMSSQVQILMQTVGMLDSRLDILQNEVNQLINMNKAE